jgi:uncharacterized protein YciI
MKQYVIIARDGNDEEALARRMAVRPNHLAGAAKLKANNQYIMGGAILSEDGTMEGSVMMLQFETEAAFTEWYNNEPYITGGVWQQIEVKPFRVADV